jgi:hypothetical protein
MLTDLVQRETQHICQESDIEFMIWYILKCFMVEAENLWNVIKH